MDRAGVSLPPEPAQPQRLDSLAGAWLAPWLRAGAAPHAPSGCSACFRAAALGSSPESGNLPPWPTPPRQPFWCLLECSLPLCTSLAPAAGPAAPAVASSSWPTGEQVSVRRGKGRKSGGKAGELGVVGAGSASRPRPTPSREHYLPSARGGASVGSSLRFPRGQVCGLPGRAVRDRTCFCFHRLCF